MRDRTPRVHYSKAVSVTRQFWLLCACGLYVRFDSGRATTEWDKVTCSRCQVTTEASRARAREIRRGELTRARTRAKSAARLKVRLG